MNASTYAGPVLVSTIYLLVYYLTMLNIMRTKFRLTAEYEARGEKFDRYFGNDREMLAADRIQLNMLEHMPPFLAFLWLNAVFVSTTFATVVGAVYVATRLIYPALLGARIGRGVKGSILVATVPGYLVIALYAGALFGAAIKGLMA